MQGAQLGNGRITQGTFLPSTYNAKVIANFYHSAQLDSLIELRRRINPFTRARVAAYSGIGCDLMTPLIATGASSIVGTELKTVHPDLMLAYLRQMEERNAIVPEGLPVDGSSMDSAILDSLERRKKSGFWHASDIYSVGLEPLIATELAALGVASRTIRYSLAPDQTTFTFRLDSRPIALTFIKKKTEDQIVSWKKSSSQFDCVIVKANYWPEPSDIWSAVHSILKKDGIFLADPSRTCEVGQQEQLRHAHFREIAIATDHYTSLEDELLPSREVSRGYGWKLHPYRKRAVPIRI